MAGFEFSLVIPSNTVDARKSASVDFRREESCSSKLDLPVIDHCWPGKDVKELVIIRRMIDRYLNVFGYLLAFDKAVLTKW